MLFVAFFGDKQLARRLSQAASGKPLIDQSSSHTPVKRRKITGLRLALKLINGNKGHSCGVNIGKASTGERHEQVLVSSAFFFTLQGPLK